MKILENKDIKYMHKEVWVKIDNKIWNEINSKVATIVKNYAWFNVWENHMDIIIHEVFERVRLKYYENTKD